MQLIKHQRSSKEKVRERDDWDWIDPYLVQDDMIKSMCPQKEYK